MTSPALLALSDDDSPVAGPHRPDLQGAHLRRLDRPAQADPVRRAGRHPVATRSAPTAPTADDVMIMPGPLYHNGPFTSSFGGLHQGAHLVVLPRFDAEETLKAVNRRTAAPGSIWCRP